MASTPGDTGGLRALEETYGAVTDMPPKYRELLGLAVATALERPQVAHHHRRAAQMYGATETELEEASTVADFTARYSALLDGGVNEREDVDRGSGSTDDERERLRGRE